MHKRKILVVAAHPDDEILGCGGTIAKHKKNGDYVSVLIMSDGVNSREDKFQNESINERRDCAKKANNLLKVDELTFLSFPDNQMDAVPLLKVIKSIENEMHRVCPDTVYTHSLSDLNIDHQIVHNATVTACRPLPDQLVTQLFFFEIPSSTEWTSSPSNNVFNPNWFTDISETLKLKLDALSLYKAEVKDFPHPRSIDAVKSLAKWRGASSGLHAAEAFELGRMKV